MRPLQTVLAFGLTSALLGGCAAIRGLDDYSFADGEEVKPSLPVAEAGAQPAPGAEGGPAATGCKHNSECSGLTTLGEVKAGEEAAISVCVKSTGTCAPLLSAECPRVVGDASNDDAIIVGAILGAGKGDGTDAFESAAFLAVEEIDSANGAGGLPPAAADGKLRPLVVVGCNVGPSAVQATRHLVEGLHVPAIIGPTTGESVVEVSQQVSVKGGTLLMTPTSVISSITNLSDDGLTWRAVPSDAQRAKLVIEQVNELETLLRATRSLTTVKLGVVNATNAGGTSAREAINGKLILNGRFITDAANEANVSLDAYTAGDADALSALATKYAVTVKPDIVFITAAEQITDFIVPLEKALTAARAASRPYYVISDAGKTEALIDAIATGAVPADTRRRVRGVGTKPDTSSLPVFAEFNAAFAARYGKPPAQSAASGAALSYDAMYSVAYAIAATPDQAVTGKSVGQGLRTLGIGDSVVVGAKDARNVVGRLATNKSVSLRGTFGTMSWDFSGDIASGTLDVWCIGTKDGAPAFGTSGLTMDVQTQVIGGAYVQCQ